MEQPSVSRMSDCEQKWSTVCGRLPKEEVIYFSQIVAIYIIIVACVVNLSLGGGNASLWSSLLSGSVGYLLPSPKIRKKNEPILPNPTEQQLQALLSEQHDG